MTFEDDIDAAPVSAADVANERKLMIRVVLAIVAVCSLVMLASSR